MQAQDVMTTKVVTVRPNTPVREIAKLMIDCRVSGLPVVDDSGRLMGMVTDGDLYRRAELTTDKQRHSWLEIFGLYLWRAERLRRGSRPHRQRRHDN